MINNLFRAVFYLFLVLLCLFIFLKTINFSKVIEILQSANWYLILFTFFLSIIASILAAFRFKILLSVLGDVSTWYVWKMSYVSSFISYFTSLTYAGGFAMNYFYAKKLKTPYLQTISVMFIDHVFTISSTLLFCSWAVLYFIQKKIYLVQITEHDNKIIFGIAVTGILLCFLIFKKYRYLLSSERFQQTIDTFLLILKSKRIIAISFGTFFLILLINLTQMYLTLLAFNLHPPILDYFLAMNLLNIVNMIPGLPAKIGQYEAAGVLSLSFLLNINKDKVFSLLLVSHVIAIVIIFVAGILSMYYLKLDIAMIQKIAALKIPLNRK